MAAIRDIHNEWRDSLVLAEFRGIQFHVETSARSGGRRTVLHEYPKRNLPYSEDMGRQATKWAFSGYLILRDKGLRGRGNLLQQRDRLNAALDADDAGMLVHPSLGVMLVLCDKWSVSEKRTAGGFYEYEMSFIEAGSPVLTAIIDTEGALKSAAAALEKAGVLALKTAFAGFEASPGSKRPPSLGE